MNNYSGIIAMIVLIAVLCFLLTRKKNEEEKEETVIEKVEEHKFYPLDTNDEDATVACLIASIDARQETKKNMQVVSVRRIG